MLASKKGYLEIVKNLVTAGAALNLQGNEMFYRENTALMYACKNGYLEIVKILINSGANLNLQGSEWARERYTALIYVSSVTTIRNRHLEIVKILVDAGADVNVQYQRGKTALIHASREGNLETVKTLIEAGANLNLQGQAEWTTAEGWTALIHAARVGHLDVVKSLIDAGADPHLKTEGGWTALMHASDQRHNEVVEFLRSDPSYRRSSVMFTSLFTALGYLAKMDGKTSQEEISFAANLMNEIKLDAEQRRQAEDLFHMGKQAPAIALITLLGNLKNEYKDDPESLHKLMKTLMQIVYLDHVISEQERIAIEEIATHLEISKSVLDTIEASLLSKSKDNKRSTSSNQNQHTKGDNQSTEAGGANSNHSKLVKISADLFEISGYLAKLDGKISQERD